MRKIDISSYTVTDVVQPSGEEVANPYDVRYSIREVLLARDQGMTARQLLSADDLSRKIKDWPDDTLLLEESEYQVLQQAFERMTGYGKYDVELVRRVLNAEEVQVQEKPSANWAETQEAVALS